ncbi:TPR repeat protein [Senna tora]|uniref:TPR repeat protein n=1 Tax=Senna tora TaxID=362788 RepID=A0A834XEZ6_9FABA|nr:TPR repeat protein [Senna tora]
MGSYAKFLWDAEEDEEDEESCKLKSDQSHTYPPDLRHPRANNRPRLSAASQA